jgi:hypothetical protein
MEKKEQKTPSKAPNPRVQSYPKEIQLECVKLLKDGLSIDAVAAKYNGHPGIRAIRRYAKRYS